MYWSVFHDLDAPFMILKKQIGKEFPKSLLSSISVFIPAHCAELAGGGSVAVAVGLVTGERWQGTGGR